MTTLPTTSGEPEKPHIGAFAPESVARSCDQRRSGIPVRRDGRAGDRPVALLTAEVGPVAGRQDQRRSITLDWGSLLSLLQVFEEQFLGCRRPAPVEAAHQDAVDAVHADES